jgi:transcriptional regulator with XRE-family HTH domain
MDAMEILRHEMADQGVTQARLAAITGIPQPRISNYLNGIVRPSKPKMDLMFSGLGLVIRYEPRVEQPDLMGSARLFWALIRQGAMHLDPPTFESWKPKLRSNIDRLRRTNRGDPHMRNITRWETLIEADDVEGLRGAMLDPTRDGQEMREVGPFTGLLPEDERMLVVTGMRSW